VAELAPTVSVICPVDGKEYPIDIVLLGDPNALELEE
jgi:hypothetical protein